MEIKPTQLDMTNPFAPMQQRMNQVEAVLRQMPSGSDTTVAEGRLPAGKGEIAPLDVALAGEDGRSARLYLSPVPASEDGDGERAIVYALETTAECPSTREA